MLLTVLAGVIDFAGVVVVELVDFASSRSFASLESFPGVDVKASFVVIGSASTGILGIGSFVSSEKK